MAVSTPAKLPSDGWHRLLTAHRLFGTHTPPIHLGWWTGWQVRAMPSLQPRWPRQSALLFTGNILVAQHREQLHRQQASSSQTCGAAEQDEFARRGSGVRRSCPPGERLLHVGTGGNRTHRTPNQKKLGPQAMSAHRQQRSVFTTAMKSRAGRGKAAVPAQGDGTASSLCSPIGC